MADKRKESILWRENWDADDARDLCKSFRIEDCRHATETMRSCLQSQYDLAENDSLPRVVKEANNMGTRG